MNSVCERLDAIEKIVPKKTVSITMPIESPWEFKPIFWFIGRWKLRSRHPMMWLVEVDDELVASFRSSQDAIDFVKQKYSGRFYIWSHQDGSYVFN